MIRTPQDLVDAGLSSAKDLSILQDVRDVFDFKIPSGLADAIRNGDSALKAQFVPSAQELLFLPEELNDPIGDEAYSPVPGITHRYPDRALLKVTYTCGVYCRFCFRRYKVSQSEAHLKQDEMEAALKYLADHPEIWEVILTGGDPFILSNEKLDYFLSKLRSMDHIKVLRFHTRIPSVSPERVDDRLLKILGDVKKAVWVSAHVNTVSELTPQAVATLRRFIDHGFGVISQSVLLKGVNASLQDLEGLFRRLVEIGVKPYYLHYPDLAQGTSHFRISMSEALALYTSLRGRLSGLAIPQFIVDIPGGAGKISLERTNARHLGGETWEFQSPLSGDWVRVQYPR